jgi:hypothetical protein
MSVSAMGSELPVQEAQAALNVSSADVSPTVPVCPVRKAAKSAESSAGSLMP